MVTSGQNLPDERTHKGDGNLQAAASQLEQPPGL